MLGSPGPLFQCLALNSENDTFQSQDFTSKAAHPPPVVPASAIASCKAVGGASRAAAGVLPVAPVRFRPWARRIPQVWGSTTKDGSHWRLG